MYLIRHILIKVQYIIIEQVHIKFCKQTLNVPWHTEITACRAELGQYPLSIDIKVSLLCYWQRLEQKSDNPLLNEISSYLLYARNNRQFYDSLNSDETFTTLVHYKNEAIKISNVLGTLVSALNNRKNFLRIG